MLVSVSCPYCGTVIKAGIGGGTACKGCKAIIYLDTKGNIKQTTPPPKK